MDDSYILRDNEMSKKDAVKKGKNRLFGIDSLAAWKNDWMRLSVCNMQGKAAKIGTTVEKDIGFNFVNTLDFSSMIDQMSDI